MEHHYGGGDGPATQDTDASSVQQQYYVLERAYEEAQAVRNEAHEAKRQHGQQVEAVSGAGGETVDTAQLEKLAELGRVLAEGFEAASRQVDEARGARDRFFEDHKQQL